MTSFEKKKKSNGTFKLKKKKERKKKQLSSSNRSRALTGAEIKMTRTCYIVRESAIIT
jgi:hypothetical protein